MKSYYKLIVRVCKDNAYHCWYPVKIPKNGDCVKIINHDVRYEYGIKHDEIESICVKKYNYNSFDDYSLSYNDLMDEIATRYKIIIRDKKIDKILCKKSTL